MRVALCALVLVLMPLIADAVDADPYTALSQGRPQEALPLLEASARANGRWDAWLDAGLAAAQSGDRGHAIAAFLSARRRAPTRDEPRQAMRALDCDPPSGWLDRLGPIGIAGSGWIGVAALALGGLALGAGLVLRRRVALATGAVLFVLGGPGQIAVWHDARDPWCATLRDTQLVDSAGEPLAAVPAGTVVTRDGEKPYAGRTLVRLADGVRGYLPVADLGCD